MRLEGFQPVKLSAKEQPLNGQIDHHLKRFAIYGAIPGTSSPLLSWHENRGLDRA
jgi:hypothetical protein